MKVLAAAFVSGLLFGAGLVVAGMTLPSKIVGFLDIFGAWDPSLGFVMVGAIGALFGLQRWILRSPAPRLAPRFALPTRSDIDAPLVIGAGLFGVGWGLGGYCPGPAVTSLASSSAAWVFVASMLAGMASFTVYERVRQPRVTNHGSELPQNQAQPPPNEVITQS